jgi:hypothetical protein
MFEPWGCLGVPTAASANIGNRARRLHRDDDAGYLAWLDGHPGGYAVNCERTPRPV